MIIQEIKIAEKKSKSTKNLDAADDRRLAADKAWPINSSFPSHLQYIVGKRTDVSDLKTNKSNQQIRIKLTSSAYEPRAGFTRRLQIGIMGYPALTSFAVHT